jgi:hypothetical protein
MYNMTLVGQPLSGKHGIKFRDGARVQFMNSILMNCGGQVVRNDNSDNEATGGQYGYGYNGTLTFAQTWTTNASVYSTVNPFTNPSAAYQAQVSGKLSQIKDTVFYGNNGTNAYTEATTQGVFASGNNNVQATQLPIQGITRGATQVLTGVAIQPVLSLDPRAANDALTAVTPPPNNGFFSPVTYRGAFSADENWLCGWTASDAYGFSGAVQGGCVSACFGDIDGSNAVDNGDVALALLDYGPCPGCTSDLDGTGFVDFGDVALILLSTGPCQ